MTWKAFALSDGYWWTCIQIRDRWTPIYRAGKVGHCVRF
jgi:hypothetical protein